MCIDIARLKANILPGASIYNNILTSDFLYGFIHLTTRGHCKIRITRSISHVLQNWSDITINILSILEKYLETLDDDINAEIITENVHTTCKIPHTKREILHGILVQNQGISVSCRGEIHFERTNTFTRDQTVKYTIEEDFTISVNPNGFITIITSNFHRILFVLSQIKQALE